MRSNGQLDLMRSLDDESIAERTKDLKVTFVELTRTLGTEHEVFVKELAIKDNFARRAARPKFLRKPCLIMLVNGERAGFSIFETDDSAQQFYQWQIAITSAWKGRGLAKVIVDETLRRNRKKYPAVVSVYDKNEVSLGLFKSCGFEIYQKKGGLYKLTRGGVIDGQQMKASEVGRVKALVGINPTNVWNSVKAEWRQEKAKWNELIEHAGHLAGVPNPTYATREGCWQKDGGLAQFATGRALNDGASVLDPFVCELALKLFMPKNGVRVYDPFGGGVQMGFVTGFYGYEFLATEIRKNQCDANNAICAAMQMKNVHWKQADSSTWYDNEQKFDLVFTCPPYYKVETYLDADGKPPAGELNTMGTYAEFRDALFRGYGHAIDMLKDDRFFVIMVGDSRDKNGAYYGCEAETEVFLMQKGLHLYNRIVYLEHQFTRAMQTKTTIRSRKLPKVEQKVIVAYKGNINNITALYEDIGRL